uniref:Uncharacterized protein n=1 Tax=Ciona savignyi TaxID=51511 RepID=H2YFI0_CIOSA
MTLEPFEAQTLNDLRLSKAYQKIMKENDKALNKLKKKHKETFTQCYNQLFAAPRRSTFLGVFFSKRRTSTVDVSIDMNPAMPDETKKRELMKLLQVQFEAERVFRIEQMDSFIMKLETVVKDHQRVEMDKLAELSAKEQAALQRQKDMEKEQNIRAIPPNLGKDEVDRKKKEINLESH